MSAPLEGPLLFRAPGREDPVPRDVSDRFAWALADSAGRRADFAGVEAYCMFVGYPRSGHSLLGSLLDAHPDIVIAHELDALGYLDAGFSAAQIYSLILDRDREFTAAGRQWSGYGYAVPGQWQGRFRRLRVIGDKKGGGSTRRLGDDPGLLARLRAAVGVPVKLLHVVRNPYDNIATIMRRRQQPTLAASIDWYFALCETVSRVIRETDPRDVETVRYERLVADPAAVLAGVCRFLGVEADADYLASCARLVWSAPPRSRDDAGWTPPQIAEVAARIARVPYLAGYAFAP